MDIGVELLLRWSLPAAIRIAEALDQFQPMWYEDPMPVDNVDELVEFARRTNVPLMASESLAGRYAYRELLERNAVGIVNIDPTWVGGSPSRVGSAIWPKPIIVRSRRTIAPARSTTWLERICASRYPTR